MLTLHITRDLPPRVRGGISTAVGAMLDAATSPAAVVSFDGWRPTGPAGGATRGFFPAPDGPVAVLRLDGPAGLLAAHAFVVESAPGVIVVHHAMLWAFASAAADKVADATGARPALHLFAHVAQGALRWMRGLDEPTGSERAQTRALAEADRVLVPSESARALLLGAHPEIDERLELVPLEQFFPAGPPPARTPEPGRVLVVGRFDVLKGTADALAMLEPLLELAPDARLVLAGGLPDNPKSEARWLRKWRDSVPRKVAGRLQATGWLTPAELAREYARAAVVVAPSRIETFGLAVLEAQRAGCPVVASDIPAHRERLPDVTLVPVTDVAALARAVADRL